MEDLAEIISFNRTDRNPLGKKTRVIWDVNDDPLYIQTFCSSYECDIPEWYLDDAKRWLQDKLNFDNNTKDKIKEGKNIIIYWSDYGRGSFDVI